jgi:hypothetical protein
VKAIKYAAFAGIALFVLLLALIALVPQEFFDRARREQEARNAPPPPRVEEGVLDRMVTFNTNGTPEPASFTITCKDGAPDGFMIKLDAPPPSPPPLRGVYGVFNFDKEPRQLIELGYGLPAMWIPREGQAGDVRELVQRFAAGDDLSFSLAKPNGSGKTVTWKAAKSFQFCKTP